MKMEVIKKVNPHMITIARESRGMVHLDLAEYTVYMGSLKDSMKDGFGILVMASPFKRIG